MKQPVTNGKRTDKMLLIIVCAFFLAAIAGCGGNGANGGNATPSPGSTNDTTTGNEDSSGNQGQPSNHNSGITDPDPASPDINDSNTDNSNPTPTNDGSGSAGQNDGSAGTGEDSGNTGAVSKSEGTFVGLADTHSVEITMNDKATVFQFGDELSDQLQQIADKTHVAFEYQEKDIDVNGETIKQLWLIKIETLK